MQASRIETRSHQHLATNARHAPTAPLQLCVIRSCQIRRNPRRHTPVQLHLASTMSDDELHDSEIDEWAEVDEQDRITTDAGMLYDAHFLLPHR